MIALAGFELLVHVMFMRDDQVWLLERHNTGVRDGFFSFPGGHVVPGETLPQAACREAQEEAGVRPVALVLRAAYTWQDEDAHGANMVFSCRNWEGTLHNAEPARASQSGFYPMQHPPSPLPAWVETALKDSASDQPVYRQFS